MKFERFPADVDEYLKRVVKTGAYQDEIEVLREAVHLHERLGDIRAALQASLKHGVETAIAEIDAGKGLALPALTDLIAEAEARRKA